MQEDNSARVDKWLWAVRMFKTRSMAADACKNGKIVIDKQTVKASRNVKVGDIIEINYGTYVKSIQVVDFPKSRVGAAIAVQYYKDITSEDEYNKLKFSKEINFEYRPRGIGRPTKKERRIIEHLKGK